jgi:1-acyl-sn-glycerol-3-phosphate acyltransferase
MMGRNVLRIFRSCLFYFVLFFSTVYLGTTAVVVYYLTRRNDQPHLCARLWGKVNLWVAGVKLHVEGLENIGRDVAFIYAANHQSLFDIFAILGGLPVQFRWLAKQELFKLPILGPAMTATGYIPIDRSDHRKAVGSLNLAARKVASGTSIMIFPEGTRSLDGVLQEFKKGGFILAIKSQQPIVPITISGSYRILPKKGEWIIQPGMIHMTICPPVPTVGFSSRDRELIMTVVRDEIRKHLPRREGGLLQNEEAASRHSDSSV